MNSVDDLSGISLNAVALSAAFSDNGEFLGIGTVSASAPSSEVRVFDSATHNQVWRFVTPETVVQLRLSNDGHYLATGGITTTEEKKTIRLAEGPGWPRIWRAPQPTPLATAFSEDGQFVVISELRRPLSAAGDSSETAVRLIETNSHRETRRFTLPGDLKTVSISPDGRYLAAGYARPDADYPDRRQPRINCLSR